MAKKILTRRGWVDAYLLAFIHIQSRRVHIRPATISPTRDWTADQGIEFVDLAARIGLKPAMIIHDRDSKFGPELLTEFGVEHTRLPCRSPNLNAHVERFIKTLEVECLDRFIVMGNKHLDHLVGEFTDYYNRQRPHSGIGGVTPMRMSRAEALPPESGSSASPQGKICCQKRVGGVLKHYYRRAA